jgi:hypothetical protein
MWHHRFWSVRGTLLWRTAAEALALWNIVVRTFPELFSFALMPDHGHLTLPHEDPSRRLQRAEAAYAQWRNRHRGERGPVFARRPDPSPVADDAHLRRLLRYHLLNANRAKLVGDPLEWPYSTHRDRVGLSPFAVGPIEREPDRFHHFVSADSTADPAGTDLPRVTFDPVTFEQVRDTVCSLVRVLPHEIERRGDARRLAVQAAWILDVRDVKRICKLTGISRSRLYELTADLPPRDAVIADPGLAAVVRCAGDPRFAGLPALELTPPWKKYLGRR